MKSTTTVVAEGAMDRLAEQLRALAGALRETADVLESATAALQADRNSRAVAVESERDMVSLRQSLASSNLQSAQAFPPLEFETRATVDTRTAAFHLNRKEQTLRGWACLENGPIRPIRINGRLAWPVVELRRACNVTWRR